MACGVSKDALEVLNYLLWKKAVGPKSSRAYDAIKRDMPDSVDVDAALAELQDAQMIGWKKKNRLNYWAFPGDAQRVLADHGYAVWRGGRIRLQ